MNYKVTSVRVFVLYIVKSERLFLTLTEHSRRYHINDSKLDTKMDIYKESL